jgi:hypothetical protein
MQNMAKREAAREGKELGKALAKHLKVSAKEERAAKKA